MGPEWALFVSMFFVSIGWSGFEHELDMAFVSGGFWRIYWIRILFWRRVLVYRLLGTTGLPYPTLLVNVAGCFVIGVLGGLGDSRQVIGTELRLFLFIGVLGG